MNAKRDGPYELRSLCQRLLATLGHPVHYTLLARIVQAHSGLAPTNAEMLSALSSLRAAGLVRRIRAGVYQHAADTHAAR